MCMYAIMHAWMYVCMVCMFCMYCIVVYCGVLCCVVLDVCTYIMYGWMDGWMDDVCMSDVCRMYV